MKTEHRFATRDKLETIQLKAIELGAKILNEQLNLDVTLQAQRQVGWGGSQAWHAGMFVKERNLIKINFRNLYGQSLYVILTVLGHEFRHAVQFKTAINSKVYGSQSYHYYNSENETDARGYQKGYAQIIINHPLFQKYIPFMNDIVGEIPMKVDYAATFNKLGYNKEEHTMWRDVFKLFKENDGEVYYIHIDQIPAVKKWTPAAYNLVWNNYRDLLHTQPWKPIMVPITLDDMGI